MSLLLATATLGTWLCPQQQLAHGDLSEGVTCHWRQLVATVRT